MQLSFGQTAVLVVVLGLAGCGGPAADRKPVPPSSVTASGTSSKTADPTPAASPSDAPADFSLSAADLIEQFLKDKAAAKARYGGKTIEVTGPIDRFTSRESGDSLALGESEGVIQIDCDLTERDPWNKLTLGQVITVRGVYSKFTADLFPKLDDSVVVQTKPVDHPLPELTALEFVKQLKDDPDTFDQKYKGKWLIVTGQIIELAKEDEGPVLEGVEGKHLHVGSTEAGEDTSNYRRIREHKVGDKVKFLARFPGSFLDEPTVKDAWELP